MVVCEFIDYLALYPGNFMRTLFRLDRTLKQSGGSLIYLLPKGGQKLGWVQKMQEEGNKVYFLTGAFVKDIFLLRRIVKENSVDIIHGHFLTAKLYARLFVLKRICKIRTICHFHNLNRLGASLRIRVRNFLCENAFDQFCGCGEAVYKNLLEAGLNKGKCSYITNAIDFTRLDISFEKSLKEELELEKSNVMLILRTHYYRKGVDIAIQAIKDMADDMNVTLLIVCSNKEFVVKEIKKQFGVCPSWVHIMPPSDDVAYYYKGVDVFLSPSRSEGLTYALIEAIYCGTMVIRSNIETQDWKLPIEEVCEPDDVISLQDSIKKVLALSVEERKAIVEEQKRYILANYSLELWVQDVQQMYLNLIQKPL